MIIEFHVNVRHTQYIGATLDTMGNNSDMMMNSFFVMNKLYLRTRPKIMNMSFCCDEHVPFF